MLAFADETSYDEFVDTLDECSSQIVSGQKPKLALLGGGELVVERQFDDQVLNFAGASSSAVKPSLQTAPTFCLVTSGVSRRLDFSKDLISKALSIVRARKDGTQAGIFLFVGSFCI